MLLSLVAQSIGSLRCGGSGFRSRGQVVMMSREGGMARLIMVVP